VRLALLGMPGVGKRTLLAELAAPARNDQQPPARSAEPGTIRLADGLIAELAASTDDGNDPAAWVAAARHAEALLLAQDLADGALRQFGVLRAALASGGIQAVPQPLPLAIRPRARGGLTITGVDDDELRERLMRWCRTRQIIHAEVLVHAPAALIAAALAVYAEAAWRRTGGARARAAQASGTAEPALVFRPALVVGTRYDELAVLTEAGVPASGDEVAEGERRLRAMAPGFNCIAVSALDGESIARLRTALTSLVGG
ncbi:MAG TPA: hypothetical protein VGN32_14165, partial [Ktedonobacterales bacterium]|nr:hypothetical protein [Ktedonobacterales bacterium]